MEQTAFAKIAYDLVILKIALGNHHLSPLLFVSDDLIPVFFFSCFFFYRRHFNKKSEKRVKNQMASQGILPFRKSLQIFPKQNGSLRGRDLLNRIMERHAFSYF